MWPKRGDALSHTLRCEAALADLWAEALRRWLPHARRAALPALTAAAGDPLPPDPAAVEQTSAVWQTIAETVIVGGLAALWAAAFTEAAEALGVTLPEPDPATPAAEVDPAVARIIAANTDLTPADVRIRLNIAGTAPTMQAAADFTATIQPAIDSTPGRVAAALTDTITNLSVTTVPDPRDLRTAIDDELDPASPLMRTYARGESYAAAGVQNHAVVTAAGKAAEPLDKTWICVHPDTVVSAVGVTHLARRRYKGTLYSVRTASGAAVALTPQHRVLTGRGWVESQSLNVGDDLFKVIGADPTGGPGVKDAPATIGEVVDAAMSAAPGEVRTVRCGVDFDGDGTVACDVEVVAADRDLAINGEASGGKAFGDIAFAGADLLAELAVLRRRGADDGIGGFGPAAVLRRDVPVEVGFGVGRDLGGAHYASGGLIADRDTGGGEYFGDLGAGTLIPLSDCSSRFSGRIGGDNVGRCRGQVGAAAGLDSEGLGRAHLGESGGVLGAQLAGFAGGAERDAVFAESTPHGFRAGSEGGGDLLGRLPGQVAAGDDVGGDPNALRAVDHVHAGGVEVLAYNAGAGSDGPRNFGGGLSGPVAGCDLVRVDGDFLAGGYTGGVEFAADGMPGGAVGGGDLVEGLTRAVAADRVVGIECVEHDGYVYDLSTESHVYLANGLITHNCTLDGKTRPSHWAADGQRVPLDGKFSVGDDLMAYPGDKSADPSEWKNCRCRVGVLAPGEAIPDEVDRHTERLDGRDSVAINRHGRTQAEEIRRRADQGNIRAREDPEGIGRVASAAPGQEDMMSELFRTFTDQAVAPIGSPTSDRRMLAAGIDLRFRSFPLPLMWKRQTGAGHDDAFTVGVIESGRVEGGQVLVSGYLLNTAEADEAAQQNAHGVSQPSIDLADAEVIMTDADGNELTEEQFWDAWENGTPVYETARAGEVIGTTLVPTPAFDTRFTLNIEREARDVALVAAAIAPPRVYPAALFADPQLSGPTPTTLDAETGRIYGHFADWNSFHRGVGLAHVRPPHSPSGYQNFHTSPPLLLDDGTRLPVGRLTVATGHADLSLGAGPAMAHYDNTGACFALVRVGEDAHGIWFSGVAAPWATPEQVEQGVSSPLSGDWRDFGRGHDLVAVLAVNTPGFAVRSRLGSDGRPAALVASVGPMRHRGGPLVLSREDVKSAVREVLAELPEPVLSAEFAAERPEVVDVAGLLARADAVVGVPSPAERVAAMLEGRA